MRWCGVKGETDISDSDIPNEPENEVCSSRERGRDDQVEGGKRIRDVPIMQVHLERT